jgi:hypothetical protein
VIESVLGGTGEALLGGQADIAVTPHVPPGFLGRPLMRAPAGGGGPAHPLHRLGRPGREGPARPSPSAGAGDRLDARSAHQTVEVEQRWTFSSMAMSIAAACAGTALPGIRKR